MPMSTRPTMDRIGAAEAASGPMPYGSRARGRVGTDLAGHAGTATGTARPRSPRMAAASGCDPDGAASRISSWSDSKPPNLRLVDPGDDVDAVALGDELGEVGPTERDAIEDVAIALEGQRRVAVAGAARRE